MAKSKLISIISLASFILVAGLLVEYINQHDSRKIFEEKILSKAKYAVLNNQKILSDKKSPDQPDMAAFQEYLMTFDPKSGNVPKDRLIQAYGTTKMLQDKKTLSRSMDVSMNWETSGSDMGGRTRAIMFDPNDPNNKKVWAGSVTGGLWYVNDITNPNEEWASVSDFWSNLTVSCITYDPNNTQVMYIGTGEAQTARIIYRESSGLGAGILKSTDGGSTWDFMESTSNFDYITDIAIKDENGTSVVYACVASGFYMGASHISQPSDGVFRSDDGGSTWSQVLPSIPSSTDNKPYTPSDIEISSSGRIFVGTMENVDEQGGATVLYSDSGLAGTWNIYEEYHDIILSESYYKIPARTLVAASPSDPNVVYVQFAAGYFGNNNFVYYRGRYMAKSMDGGLNWTDVNIPDPDWSTLAWHAFVLEVSPTDPNTVFTGGLDLWKSSNGGDNWDHISDWVLMYYGGGDDYVHADQHSIQFQPGSSSTAIFSCDGGVFLTNTANQSYPVFIERNQGYSTLQFYSCAIKPIPGSNQYIGGLQDNGTLFHSGNPLSINNMIDGGDGAYCFWDQDQFNIYITSVYYNNYTAWSNNSQSSNFGGNSGTFISPADYDDEDNILYSNAVTFTGGNANQLLRVKNIPSNVNEQLVDIGTNSNVPFSHIKNSSYAPIGTSTLFVGTQSGKLYRVINAHTNPVSTEIGSSEFPTANISCIALGNSEDELLVTFSNYGISSVWLTMDGGDSWIEKEADLPDMPIRWAIFHPENNGQALLATEIGIWSTNTLQEESTLWEPNSNGMANVRVDMLKLRKGDNVVLAATHGRGLFTAEFPLDIYVGINSLSEEKSFNIFPNPDNDVINISSSGEHNTILVTISDINGRKVFETKPELTTKSVSVYLPGLTPGNYIISVESDGIKERQKLLITR